jgi:FkbM family methyltransferase
MSLIERMVSWPGKLRAMAGLPARLDRLEARLLARTDEVEAGTAIACETLARDPAAQTGATIDRRSVHTKGDATGFSFGGLPPDPAAARLLSLAEAKWALRSFPVRRDAPDDPAQKLRERAVLAIAAARDDDVLITTTYGAVMRVRPQTDVVTSRALLTDAVYEENISEVIAHILCPGDVFLDIGANVGAHSIRAALAVGAGGRVVSFEPNPRVRAQLAEHFRMNGIDNADIVPHAVGAEPGSFKLLVSSRHAGSGTIMTHGEITDDYLKAFNSGNADSVNVWKLALPGETDIAASTVDEAEVYDVEVRPLHDLIGDAHRDRVALLKIDVEGKEADVLASADFLTRAAVRPCFIVEYEERPHVGGRRQDVYGYFAERGYGMFLVTYDVSSRSTTFNRLSQAAIRSDFENLVAIPLEKIDALTDGCLVFDYAH